MTWGWTRLYKERNRAVVLAAGTGRALEGTAEGQLTQGGGVSSAKAEGYLASRHGDFPLLRGVMFILSDLDTAGPLLI